MSALLRCRSLRRLPVLLGLALMALVAAPSASGAAQVDTVSATGTAEIGPGQGFSTPAEYSNVDINARSGTSGQNASGSVSFVVSGLPRRPDGRDSLFFIGPVTCLHVMGPDQGAGTATLPTTAVLTFMNLGGIFPFFSVTLVDKGGNGADTISSEIATTSNNCSQPFTGANGTFTNGRAVVSDAPVLPTSKDQCKNGGYRNYPQFKNQGDCVSFVNNGK